MATKDILMDGDKVCIAWFKKKIKEYTLTTKAEPVEGGTVTGAGTYNEGTVATVEAIPAVDYDFDHWGGDAVNKWLGLGMVLFDHTDPDEYDDWLDTLLANGFTEFRCNIHYPSTTWLAQNKAAVIRAVAKGAKYVWGVGSAWTTITSTNWPTFRQAILDNAQWAQDNGVFEFQIGNEECNHVDGTTMTVAQIITNLKAVATEVKAIFTNGNVSYAVHGGYVSNWIAAGKGDIDLLSFNIYRGGTTFNDYWETIIDAMVAEFGVAGTYLTEFGLSSADIDYWSTDEAVQATGLTEMIDYIKASGIPRAFYHLWYHGTLNMGVLKFDKVTYRQLWDSLLNSG